MAYEYRPSEKGEKNGYDGKSHGKSSGRSLKSSFQIERPRPLSGAGRGNRFCNVAAVGANLPEPRAQRRPPSMAPECRKRSSKTAIGTKQRKRPLPSL